MTDAQIAEAFRDGIPLPDGVFEPLFWLERVDDPEFGCEGRPEEGPIYGNAYGFDRNGRNRWKIEELALILGGFDDCMWVGRWQDGYALLRENQREIKPLKQELFETVFPPLADAEGE